MRAALLGLLAVALAARMRPRNVAAAAVAIVAVKEAAGS